MDAATDGHLRARKCALNPPIQSTLFLAVVLISCAPFPTQRLHLSVLHSPRQIHPRRWRTGNIEDQAGLVSLLKRHGYRHHLVPATSIRRVFLVEAGNPLKYATQQTWIHSIHGCQVLSPRLATSGLRRPIAPLRLEKK